MVKINRQNNPYKWVNLHLPIYGEALSYMIKTSTLSFYLVKLLSTFKEKNARKSIWLCRLWHRSYHHNSRSKHRQRNRLSFSRPSRQCSLFANMVTRPRWANENYIVPSSSSNFHAPLNRFLPFYIRKVKLGKR